MISSDAGPLDDFSGYLCLMMTVCVMLVRPFDQECFRLISESPAQIMSDGAHFSVHKSVSEDHFFSYQFMRDPGEFPESRLRPRPR